MTTYNNLKKAIQANDITTFEAIMDQIKTIDAIAYDCLYYDALDYITIGCVYIEDIITKEDKKESRWDIFEDLFLGSNILMICSQIDELNNLN